VKQKFSSKKLSPKKIPSAKLKETLLEKSIHKILQSELKLIFSDHFFQDSSPIISEQITFIQKKIKSPFSVSGQNDISASFKDLISDKSSQEEESLDNSMKIYFV